MSTTHINTATTENVSNNILEASIINTKNGKFTDDFAFVLRCNPGTKEDTIEGAKRNWEKLEFGNREFQKGFADLLAGKASLEFRTKFFADFSKSDWEEESAVNWEAVGRFITDNFPFMTLWQYRDDALDDMAWDEVRDIIAVFSNPSYCQEDREFYEERYGDDYDLKNLGDNDALAQDLALDIAVWNLHGMPSDIRFESVCWYDIVWELLNNGLDW